MLFFIELGAATHAGLFVQEQGLNSEVFSFSLSCRRTAVATSDNRRSNNVSDIRYYGIH
jgi:hypothetical protein